MTGQTPLALRFDSCMDFARFYVAGNEEAVAALIQLARGTGGTQVHLWGETGHGKTHLLHATCALAHATGRRTLYLPLTTPPANDADIFDGLDAFDLVCLDDVDVIAGNPGLETALFHAFNRLSQKRGHLLTSARTPPAQLAIALPDLKSRLAWGVALRLNPLADDDKLAALTARAQQRGLDLPQVVGRFLLTRCPRDLPSLWALLDRLDQASLAAGRPLTIPFVKTLLGESS